MELRHLRYFVAVADAGGFAKAAANLRMSQPALSRQIRDLEAELGVRLFDRVGRRTVLTTEGDDLLRRSRDLLRDAGALAERAQALSGGQTGVLRVGATPQTLESVLSSFLTRYRRPRPGIEIQLTEDGAISLASRLERGELHLALGMVQRGGRLRSRPLFPVRVLSVVSASHPLRRRTAVELKELADEALLVLRRQFGTRQIFDAACRIAQLQPRIVFESAHPHSLVTLAEADHGVAIVPSTLRILGRAVRALPLVYEGKSVGAWSAIIWDPRRFLPSYAGSFIEELVSYTRRSYPGRQFRRAPPVPPPEGQETATPRLVQPV